jgi:hypothetical protein
MTERPYETTLPADLTSDTPSASHVSTGGNGTSSLGAGSASEQRSGSTASAVGDEAKSVASDAADGGRRVAETAASGAKDVVAEATTQARQLFDQLRSELDGQASAQGQRAVAGLRSLADELRQMAAAPDQRGVAGEAAQQAADRASSFADWLDNRAPGDILDEARSLARRRPGAFLLGAAAIGLLGGRMTRGLTGAGSDQQPSGVPAYPTGTGTGTGAGAGAGAGIGAGVGAGVGPGAYGVSGTPATAAYPTAPGAAAVPSDDPDDRPEPYNVGVRDTDTHSVTTTDRLTTDATEVMHVEGESEARG